MTVEFSPGYDLMHTLFWTSLRNAHTLTMWCSYLHLKILANNILSKYKPNTYKTQFGFQYQQDPSDNALPPPARK